MIGLGSNRLTVCRRGGMSVTQAGRGGMEWLGVREPLWAQWWLPYSRQAGEALKAQFPTQWPTIRDYGFAHPALVPFINEDPMMVCSLGIEGLPIRWIESRKTGAFDLGFKMTTGTTFEIQFMLLSLSNVACIIAEESKWNYACPLCDVLTTGRAEWNFTSQNQIGTSAGVVALNTAYKIELSNGQLKIGNVTASANPMSSYSAAKNMMFFDQTKNASSYRMDGRAAYLKSGGDNEHWFVPFLLKDGETETAELLDLTASIAQGAKVFATKYGSFTISETPAS